MKRVFLLLTLAAFGCRSGTNIPETPTYCLFLPAGDWQWKREVADGFSVAAKQFNLKAALVEYSQPNADSIMKAVATAPDPKKAPLCIVFTRTEAVKPVLEKLWEMNRVAITIGEDAMGAARIGHTGEASASMAYLWNIRIGQMKPIPKRALFVIGDSPVNRSAISGALYARSEEWTRYQLHIRDTTRVTKEDFDWCDVVCPIGEDALAVCEPKAGGKPLIPIDGSKATLDLLESGRVKLALAPNYFQMGYRAARLARERFVTGSISSGPIHMPYREVVKDLIPWYLHTRYQVPPVVNRRDD